MLAQLLAAASSSGYGFLWFSLVWLAATVLWLWTLVDCLTARRVSGREKIVWVIVLLCTHILGALLYFVFVRCRRIGKKLPPTGP